MVRAAHIDVIAGPGRGYRRAACLVSVIAALVLTWHQSLMPVALFLVGMAGVLYGLLTCISADSPAVLPGRGRRAARWLGRVIRRLPSPVWNGSLRLGRDGSAEIGNQQGRWLARCWTSRHLVVLRLAGLPQARTVLICRDSNHPDDFRRLLVWARFDPRDNPQAPGLTEQP